MASFSQSVKSLNTSIETADIKGLETTAEKAASLNIQDKVKFLCAHRDQINKALDLAKIFTGAKGDKILNTVKEVIGSLCPE
jgi:hypothetical protein